MVYEGPDSVEGWDDFLEDENDVWLEAFETEKYNGEPYIDADAYDEFDSVQEIVNFVAGTGTYEDRNGFTPGEKDKDMRKREMHNDTWKVPEKVRRFNEHVHEGVPLSDINVDMRAETGWYVEENEAERRGSDIKYTAHFCAYDEDDTSASADARFYMAFSWYDKSPEDINLEEEMSLDDVDDVLED